MKEQLKIYEEKMDKTIDSLMNDYASIRAGRANPHVLDKIKVDYYGTPTPIQQVGNISVPEARMILIQPWDKSLLKAAFRRKVASMVQETDSYTKNEGHRPSRLYRRRWEE